MEEQDAITLLKIGDLNGLEPFVDAYYLKAARTADLIVGSQTFAEDIVQSTYLDAAHHIRELNDAPFAPWFLKMVVDNALKSAQKQKLNSLQEVNPILTAWLLEESPTAELPTEGAELRRQTWQALQGLTPTQRATLVMRYFVEETRAPVPDSPTSPLMQARVELLSDLAADRIPTIQNPWKSIQAKILAYDASKSRKPISLRLGCVLIVLVAGALLVLFIYMTGQSQLFINKYFNNLIKSEMNQLPTPAAISTATPIPPPTQVPTLASTRHAYPTQVEDGSVPGSFTLSFRTNANGEPIPFEILIFLNPPPGYRQTHLFMNSETASVSQMYQPDPEVTGELIALTQSQTDFPKAAGESKVLETLDVAGVLVQKMAGGWLHLNSLEVGSWTESDPLQTYRWEKNGYTFTLTTYIPDPLSTAHLDKMKILTILEALVSW